MKREAFPGFTVEPTKPVKTLQQRAKEEKKRWQFERLQARLVEAEAEIRRLRQERTEYEREKAIDAEKKRKKRQARRQRQRERSAQ